MSTLEPPANLTEEESRVPRGPHGLARMLGRRTVAAVVTLVVVSILIFVVTTILPGNVASILLGHRATPVRVHALEARLGLERPAVERYVSWVRGVVHGDWGVSAVAEAQNDPNPGIAHTLGEPLANSLILAGITSILLVPLTLFLGAVASLYPRRFDHVISIPALVFSSLPEFVTGALLIFVFFSRLHLLSPVTLLRPGQSPFSQPTNLILPVLTLLAVSLGSGVRQVRAGMLETFRQVYVRVARLNGIRERRVRVRYALRNALAPSVQAMAQNLQYLLGGIIVVESIFAYPGIGTYLVNAVSARDVTEVQSAALILAAVYIAINILADTIVILLVPKLRTSV